MTQTQGARAAAMPATTAPPRPPSRSPGARWMSASSRRDLARALGDDVGRGVVGVVDDDELGMDARERLVEALDEGAYAGLPHCALARRSSVQASQMQGPPGRRQKRVLGPGLGMLVLHPHSSPWSHIEIHVGVRRLVWLYGY